MTVLSRGYVDSSQLPFTKIGESPLTVEAAVTCPGSLRMVRLRKERFRIIWDPEKSRRTPSLLSTNTDAIPNQYRPPSPDWWHHKTQRASLVS